jgi:hypothetical protein
MANSEKEIVHLLDGTVQEGEFVNFFNAGYDFGMVVHVEAIHRNVYCSKKTDSDGNVFRQEIPGYEEYP